MIALAAPVELAEAALAEADEAPLATALVALAAALEPLEAAAELDEEAAEEVTMLAAVSPPQVISEHWS